MTVDWDFLKTLALIISMGFNVWLSHMLLRAIAQLRQLGEDTCNGPDQDAGGGA